MADATCARGRFWNYLSVGNDAQATHGFHTLRDARPWAAPGRLITQAWYVAIGCLSGWFCGAPPARHAVSEGFVVATRRTRTAGKVEIPNVDDHVSKLEHMGKETVKKLQDVAGSAAAVGVGAL